MTRRSIRVITDQPLRDTAGLTRKLTVDGPTLDMDEKNRVHKIGRFLHGKQGDTRANLGSSANRRRKTNFIQSVVQAHRDARADMNRLLQKIAEQRKCQESVSNGPAEGRFALGALRVEMNPLLVPGGVGKFLNTILRDHEPIRNRKFASFELLQRSQVLNLKRRHRSFHDDINRRPTQDKGNGISI